MDAENLKNKGYRHVKNKRHLGLICALFATMLWASNYPVSRFLFNIPGVENLDEWGLAWFRIAIGAFVLLPVTFLPQTSSWGTFKREYRKDWKIFLFLSACIIAESVFCFLAAKYTTGARASLFANTSPVFTLLISVLAAKELLNKRKVTGILMGLSGIVLAAFSKGGDMFSGGTTVWLGDLLALISGIFWALFTVFGGVAASRYNGIFCTVFYRLIGVFLLIPVLIVFNGNITFNMPWLVWFVLFYFALLPGGVGIWLWSIAQKYVEPGILGAFSYLSAFCAAIFSLLFLKEQITWNFILAFCLIIGGIALLISRKKTG